MKDMGITGKLGKWFYHFLVNRTQFVRLPGGSSTDSHVISGVPQGTAWSTVIPNFNVRYSEMSQTILSILISTFKYKVHLMIIVCCLVDIKKRAICSSNNKVRY